MYTPIYYRATIPTAPWNRSGKATVTVRVGGSYEVYLCIGYDRIALRADEGWALLTVLSTALPAEFGAAPAWTDDPVRRAEAA